MSFSTKAIYLNSHGHSGTEYERADARSVESNNESVSRLVDGLPSRSTFRTDIFPLLMSLLCVGVITALLLPLSQDIAASLVPIAYLIPVIVAATRWGIWPATLASIASMAAADFFFFLPLYSFRVEDPQEAIDLLLFLAVALVSGNLASRLRRETETLRRREGEIQRLYEFSRLLAACFTVSDLISAIEKYLSRALGQQAVFCAARPDDHFEAPESGSIPKVVRERISSMIATIGEPSCVVVDEPVKNAWLLAAICSETAVHGLVAINIGGGSREAVSIKRRRSEAILEEVSLTLQRLDIEKAMEDAQLHLQAQLLRDAFHGTISHELCTPLAAIRGSASVLDSMPEIREDKRLHSLVEAISGEVAELNGFVQNILNATRVTAGGVCPSFNWVDPRDIIDAAIKGGSRRLAAHKIETEFSDELPLVNVDSGLIEESCGQLIENAAKYSPSGSTISIRTRAEHGNVIFSISDQGVGITPDEHQHLGRRSYRSRRHRAISGSGLGFWIASTFVKANGGTIDISSQGQRKGATASITLPGAAMKVSQLKVTADE